MGMFALAELLNRNCIDVEIIHTDLEMGHPIDKMFDLDNVDAIGIDCHWHNESLVAMDAARLIKNKRPDLFVFMGGYTVSFFAEEIMNEFTFIDAIIKGDAERPIVELCQRLNEKKEKRGNENRHDFRGIPNLIWRDFENVIHYNEQIYIANKSDLEFLDFAQVNLLRNWEFYKQLCRYSTKFAPINESPLFFLEIGRGCIFNCKFCGGASVAQKCINSRTHQVYRSIDSVIATIKKAMEFGYRCFYTCYDFEGSDEWFTSLFKEIKKEQLSISFGYGCWTLPSKELVDALSECAEQAIIEISPESGNLSIRMRNKDRRISYSNEAMEKFIEYIAKTKNVKAELFFSYFLIDDTVDTVFETMRYIEKLYCKYSEWIEIFFDNLSTDPASLLFLNPEKYNIHVDVQTFKDYLIQINAKYIEHDNHYLDMTLHRPKSLSYDDAAFLMKKIRLFTSIFLNFGEVILFLNKTGNYEHMVSDFIARYDKDTLPKTELSLNELRTTLNKMIQFNTYYSPDVYEIIEEEYGRSAKRRNIYQGF